MVTTYPKKHDIAPDKWHEVQSASVQALKGRIPADPMTVSLGLESSVLPELQLISHVDAMQVGLFVFSYRRYIYTDAVFCLCSLFTRRRRWSRWWRRGNDWRLRSCCCCRSVCCRSATARNAAAAKGSASSTRPRATNYGACSTFHSRAGRKARWRRFFRWVYCNARTGN